MRCAQIRMEVGKAEHVRPSEQVVKGLQVPGLRKIIGLLMQLELGLLQQRREIHVLRHNARKSQERRNVVDVAVDAGAYARILDLYRQVAPVVRLCAMQLPDRGGRERADVEAREVLLPTNAPLGVQHALKLLGGHVRGPISQRGHNRGHLRRKNNACIH